MADTRRVLLVANRTATTEALQGAVRHETEHGPVRFHLVVPATPRGLHRFADPEVAGQDAARERMAVALPLLSAAAGSEVTGQIGDAEPQAAIQDALNGSRFDQVIISTLPRRLSRWLRCDLPSKARHLGLPVTHLEAEPSLDAAGSDLAAECELAHAA